MIICEFEGELKDNPLFRIVERELEGKGYAIVGNDPDVDDLEFDEVSDEEEVEDVSTRTDGTQDALDNNEVVWLQGGGSDPELFAVWEELEESLVTNTYTDEFGNDLFSFKLYIFFTNGKRKFNI